MLEPKRKREVFVVTAVVLAIATSFAYLVATMLKAPRRAQEMQTRMEPTEEEIQRSPELNRIYGGRLSVHTPGESSSTSKAAKADAYGVFVPDNDLVADSTSISAFNNFNALPPMPAPRPGRRAGPDVGEDGEDDDQQFSGWGWLFDDMETSRAGRETQPAAPGDQFSDDDEEDDMQSGLSRRSAMGEEDVFFMRDAGGADVMRPVFADQTRPRESSNGDMDAIRTEAAHRASDEVSGLVDPDDLDARQTNPMALRDPFASSGFDRAADNVALLRPARAEDVFFRGRDNLPIPSRESYARNSGADTAARTPSALNFSGSAAASAGQDWSISASSDRAFASPAGYGSIGPDSSLPGSGSFSMPSSFGAGSSFSAPSPSIGSASLGGSMGGATAPSSGFSGFGSGAERAGPSALPW